jgi:hypothetical protein
MLRSLEEAVKEAGLLLKFVNMTLAIKHILDFAIVVLGSLESPDRVHVIMSEDLVVDTAIMESAVAVCMIDEHRLNEGLSPGTIIEVLVNSEVLLELILGMVVRSESLSMTHAIERLLNMNAIVSVLELIVVLAVDIAGLETMEGVSGLFMHRLFNDEVHWVRVISDKVLLDLVTALMVEKRLTGSRLDIDSVVVRHNVVLNIGDVSLRIAMDDIMR